MSRKNTLLPVIVLVASLVSTRSVAAEGRPLNLGYGLDEGASFYSSQHADDAGLNLLHTPAGERNESLLVADGPYPAARLQSPPRSPDLVLESFS